MTIPMPPEVASPTFNRPRPVLTTRPSPPAPIRAAMTTIDKASIRVWFSPARMVRIAMGNCKSQSICQRVEPKDCAASIRSWRTPRMPRLVRRTMGGMAKMIVAMIPGVIPTPKSITIGTR